MEQLRVWWRRVRETFPWSVVAMTAAWLAGRRLLPLREPEPAPSGDRKRVVVVGAGFGGLTATRVLGGSRQLEVILLDRNNYHGFWPLLYQVATAGLEPTSIAFPARAILRKHHNIRFQMADVRGVDFQRKEVLTEGDPIPYDYLILAAGSTNNYFGNESLAAHTFGLKDIDEAERLRNHVLSVFEQAVCEEDPERLDALLTFVIVGAGPTGVELAGAFSELFYHVLRKDYPTLDVSRARIVLVEAADTLLSTFPESLQDAAITKLREMGVEINFGKVVESVEGGVVKFEDGGTMRAETVVWTAGVRAADLADALQVSQARAGRVKVTPTLNLPDHPDVFVIGDMAHLEGYGGEKPYPMVAPVAVQQGRRAALNIMAREAGEPAEPFHYFDKGQMATIGRRAAVLDAFGVHLHGRFAWLGWLFIHLLELVGFRNRLVVLINWAYNYFTYDRAIRIITGPSDPLVGGTAGTDGLAGSESNVAGATHEGAQVAVPGVVE